MWLKREFVNAFGGWFLCCFVVCGCFGFLNGFSVAVCNLGFVWMQLVANKDKSRWKSSLLSTGTMTFLWQNQSVAAVGICKPGLSFVSTGTELLGAAQMLLDGLMTESVYPLPLYQCLFKKRTRDK